MTTQLTPITEPYPEDVAKVLASYPQQGGYILALFRVFANSLRFLKKAVPNLLDKDSPLPLRIREIVILRVTANKNCEYEWGVHVSAFGSHAKLTDAQIAATRSEQVDDAIWSPAEACLLRAVDNLCASGKMDNIISEKFARDWSKEQQLEIIALCGTYHTISFVANAAGVNLRPFRL